MPSFHIHLAVGKRYIEKHQIENKEEFLKGIIAPDFTDNKDKTHYGIPTPRVDLIECAKNKVIIEDFLKENKIETDYDKGVLLHLLTDKIFFNEFFSKAYYNSHTYEEFCTDLYESYNVLNPYLTKKYNLSFSEEEMEKMKKNIKDSKNEKKITTKKGSPIISIEKLEEFIEDMSDINLENYIDKK